MKQAMTIMLLCGTLFALAGCVSTAAPQPAATPRPTIPPTPTVPVNNYADIILWPADLPSGFEPLSSEDSFFDVTQSLPGATLESRFSFVRKDRNPELITGSTMRVADPANRSAIDLVLNDPEELLATIASGLPQQVVSKQTLSNLARLGDASAGISITYLEGQDRWTMDMTLFREDEAVVFIAMAYRENDLPPLPLSAFAYKLADRAKRLTAAPGG